VRGAHLAIPLLLLVNAAGVALFPSFALVSFSMVFIKAIDFSLFGVSREMLYVSMKVDEKFRAKAVIDVFAYRTSKALVSLCILGLQFFAGMRLLFWVSYATIAILLLWIGVVWFLLRRHYPAQVKV
jgi:ATP/ADP translocase